VEQRPVEWRLRSAPQNDGADLVDAMIDARL